MSDRPTIADYLDALYPYLEAFKLTGSRVRVRLAMPDGRSELELRRPTGEDPTETVREVLAEAVALVNADPAIRRRIEPERA